MKSTTILIAAAALVLPLAALSQTATVNTNAGAGTSGPNTSTGTNASTQTNVTAPTGGALNNTTPAAADTQTKVATHKHAMKKPAVEPASDAGATTTRSPTTPTSKNDGMQKP